MASSLGQATSARLQDSSPAPCVPLPARVGWTEFRASTELNTAKATAAASAVPLQKAVPSSLGLLPPPKARCHAVRFSLERPPRHGAEGDFQPGACKGLAPQGYKWEEQKPADNRVSELETADAAEPSRDHRLGRDPDPEDPAKLLLHSRPPETLKNNRCCRSHNPGGDGLLTS